METIDYKKVYSQLSHIKALSHDQKFDQVVQNLITYSIFNSTSNITNENDLTENIKAIYGITLRLHIIQSNLDRLFHYPLIVKEK